MNQEEATKKELIISEGKKSSSDENDSLNILTPKVKENVPRIT